MTSNNSLNQTDHPRLTLKVNSPKASDQTERTTIKAILQNLTMESYVDNVSNDTHLQIEDFYYRLKKLRNRMRRSLLLIS